VIRGALYWILQGEGHAVAQLVEALRYKQKGHEFDSRWCLIKLIPGIFTGIQAAGACSCHPYHLNVLTGLKYGSLYLLERSGPVQACNGTALTVRYNVSLLLAIFEEGPGNVYRRLVDI
jgi:hypothetical protein